MCWIQPLHFHHVGDSLINQACLGCLNGLSEFPELIEGTTHRIKPWVKPHGFIKFPSTNSSIGSLLAQISLLVCVFFSVYINILQYIYIYMHIYKYTYIVSSWQRYNFPPALLTNFPAILTHHFFPGTCQDFMAALGARRAGTGHRFEKDSSEYGYFNGLV